MKLALAAMPIAALAVAGCASTGSTAATRAQAAPASPSCATLESDWRASPARSYTEAINGDFGAVYKAANALSAAAANGADLSGPESTLQSAASAMQSDTQSAGAYPPPACIPGARAAYSRAMTSYAEAAGDFQDAVSELTGGSDAVAMGDVAAGGKAMKAGDAAIGKAADAVQAFDSGRP